MGDVFITITMTLKCHSLGNIVMKLYNETSFIVLLDEIKYRTL
jgi:hypothetical protein